MREGNLVVKGERESEQGSEQGQFGNGDSRRGSKTLENRAFITLGETYGKRGRRDGRWGKVKGGRCPFGPFYYYRL